MKKCDGYLELNKASSLVILWMKKGDGYSELSKASSLVILWVRPGDVGYSELSKASPLMILWVRPGDGLQRNHDLIEYLPYMKAPAEGRAQRLNLLCKWLSWQPTLKTTF